MKNGRFSSKMHIRFSKKSRLNIETIDSVSDSIIFIKDGLLKETVDPKTENAEAAYRRIILDHDSKGATNE